MMNEKGIMMEQTRITFLGGLDTIGGNIISIEHGNYRVITDFGAQVGVSIEEQLDETATIDLLNSQRLPLVDGIYTRSMISESNLVKAFEDSDMETIICLSHLHIDHIGSLKHIARDIPIFALADAAPFYELLVETDLLPDYEFTIQGIEPLETLEFGPFNIQFHESDHDTIGAASIFIETPDLKIVYSGDLRLSGFHPERVVRWAQEARDWQADLLLIEGTSYSFGKTEPTPEQLAIDACMEQLSLETEVQGIRAFQEILNSAADQCIAFNGYPQNIERLFRWAQLARENGRNILVQADMMHLLQPFNEEQVLFEVFSADKLPEIQAHPGQYFIQVDDQDVTWLECATQGIYLHSNGRPLGHYMPGYAEFVGKIVEHGWTFIQAGISGHAHPADLLMLAYLIQAQVIVPWHTFNRLGFQEALNQRGISTWMPDLQVTYSADQIQTILSKETGHANN